MSKLYAINKLQMRHPEDASKLVTINAGRVFDCDDTKTAEHFKRHGAAREATKAEIANEEDRELIDGAATVARERVFASVATGSSNGMPLGYQPAPAAAPAALVAPSPESKTPVKNGGKKADDKKADDKKAGDDGDDDDKLV